MEAGALDVNTNQQSDVWEMVYSSTGMAASADTDSDGVNNRGEAIAGTDPQNAASYPAVDLLTSTGSVPVAWASQPGKLYQVLAADDLANPLWSVVTNATGDGSVLSHALSVIATTQRFVRLTVSDVDSDGDQLSDWEEMQIGFDPERTNTERFSQTDLQRATAGMTMMSTVTVTVVDGECYERWPDPAVIAIRRSGGIKPITVNLLINGTATRNTDYTTQPGNTIVIPAGRREVWVEISPVADAQDAEATETIIVTAQAGTGYVLGTNTSATVNLVNETAASLPNPKSAGRFLVQAAFGPDADSTNDVDIIPENVEQVQSLGFDDWIDDQFTRPVGLLQPFTEYAPSIPEFYTDHKEAAWWNRAMGVTNLAPGGPAILPDPLRQRVAFALSQIVVVSDRVESLGVNPIAMANYYDTIVTNAFGNYRDLLYNVTLHPCMGVYLSHLKNQKPNPTNNIFPDENYAREIMQLFSIGLWELNQDGTRKLDNLGKPIPTYDNVRITQFARVFTGLSYGGAGQNSFLFASENLVAPMKMWDAYHDCDAKTLLNGQVIPARTPSNPDTGATGLLDLNEAINNIFNHSNVPPFVCKQLIQRFITSNPSTGYIWRVAAAFINNGSGVRGDMKAVIKTMLLDPEARDPVMMSDPKFGKQREPFLRVVNFGRAFNAASQEGFYPLDNFFMDHYQEPMKAPSVFNFYLPGYTPPGPIGDAGLVGPEFQILNAGSAMSTANYYLNAVRSGLHRWGSGLASRAVVCDLTQELALVQNIDALVRRLDLHLTYGTLSPRHFQVIREAVERVPVGMWEWEKERVYLAIYLITTSPEFSVMR